MKVAIITRIMPHYRAGLFRSLDSADGFEFVHYSDPDDPGNGIKPLAPADVSSFRNLRNMTFGRATWQFGAVRAALNREFDAYIFTGDASYLSTWIAAFAARLNNADVYFWTMGWRRREKGIKRIVRLAFYQLAHELLVYSPRGKKLGVSLGYPEKRISVIYNSVTPITELNRFESSSKGTSVWTLGAVARLTSAKQFDLLLDAASVLQRRGQPVRLVFGGDGQEREKLQSSAEALGVNVQFTGSLYSEAELRAFYDDLMVTVVPAATGLAAIQSLAYGVPVITNDDLDYQGPEVAAVIEGSTGSLYKKDDINDLVRTITFWATKVSEDRAGVADACHAEVAERWTFNAQANFMLAAISEAGKIA